MRLKAIETRNYRTLQELRLQFLPTYCTISGKNNAGKSCIIRLLSILFNTRSRFPWHGLTFDYEADKTQWVKTEEPVVASITLEVTKQEDPALISFIEKIATATIATDAALITISYEITSAADPLITVDLNATRVDEKAAKEIVKRIKDSNLLFLYNSTTRTEDIYYSASRRSFYEFVMSAEEKKILTEAGKQLERKLRNLAKQRTEGLASILSRLDDKYDVELSPLDGFAAHEIPVGINLKDRNVEVPIDDWGSGTQNRTKILMAILQAHRIKTMGEASDRITPIVVVEEPESFLHPSAQAEFGRLLRRLSEELGIQIVVTTHSPHMLNQEEPEANILLDREVKRRKVYQTIRVETAGDTWMAPFADHLGIGAAEFKALRPLFAADKRNTLLVEGAIDQEYFELFQGDRFACGALSPEINIVPYGGKDTLKNTVLLQFVLATFDKVCITYDLDAAKDVKAALLRLGLKEGTDCLALGKAQEGCDCIEGLLPASVLSLVNGRETELIMKLGSKSSDVRREAKCQLKRLYLAEFKSRGDYSKNDLDGFAKAIAVINKTLAV